MFKSHLSESSIGSVSLNTLENTQRRSGGRVNIEPFGRMKPLQKQTPTDYNDALKGINEETLLSKAYFSKENIQIIQNALRKGVYELSKGKFIIPEQNVDEIKKIMRTFFLENSRHLPHHIPQQIQELNNDVIEYCVPMIYNECIAHVHYLDEIRLPYTPMSRPVLSTTKGGQVLERKFENISIF